MTIFSDLCSIATDDRITSEVAAIVDKAIKETDQGKLCLSLILQYYSGRITFAEFRNSFIAAALQSLPQQQSIHWQTYAAVTTMKEKQTMKFQFKEGSSFHRLVDEETGEVTDWADYTSFTYLNGYVGYTIYYSGETDGVCPADEFCKMAGVGKLEDEQNVG